MIFPDDRLPKFLKEFSKDISSVYGVPIEFCVVSLISGIATAIGNKAKLQTEKYVNYPQFWFVIVAPSGTGKSEPLAVAYKPIHDHENREFERHKESIKEWKKQCFRAKINNEPQPEKPKQSRITCSDTTPEALFELLSENPALTIYRDELVGHFQDIGRYNKSGEVAHYLSCFNNKQFSIDRKGNDLPIFVSKPILSMIGTIQPEVLQKIASGNFMRENGYLQRCLFVYPDEVKSSPYSKKKLKPDLVSKYENTINFFLNQSETKEYKLDDGANALYISFFDEMAGHSNKTSDDYLKALYSKMGIHVLRLALVLSVIENDTPNTISFYSFLCAVELCRYFIETGRKMYAPPTPPKPTNGEMYRLIHETIGIKNQAAFALSLGVSPTAVSKALSKITN